MTQPRQIIYPLRYVTPWFARDETLEERFVENVSARFGDGAFILPVGRARAGIYLLIKSAVTLSRRRVILSPYTIADVVNMVRFSGGEPVFVDCSPGSTNIDMGHLESLVDNRTACVLITHYHVSQTNTPEIVALCHAKGAKVFEDCAISFGADYRGAPIGTLADGAVFSLSGFKIVNFFWGGFIVTKDADLHRALGKEIQEWPRLRMPQYFDMAKKVARYDILTSLLVFPLAFRARNWRVQKGVIEDIIPRTLIETHSLDETILSRPSLAAFREWNRKLIDVDRINAHRRKISALYDRALRRISAAPETDPAVRAGSSFYSYPILVGAENREALYREVLNRGFDIGLMVYPNLHATPQYADIEGRSTNVAALTRSLVNLPTHPRINARYAAKLMECVVDVLTQRGVERALLQPEEQQLLA